MRPWAKIGLGVAAAVATIHTLGVYFTAPLDGNQQTIPLPVRYTMPVDAKPKSVAIIGAGAGGSSTAYFLHKFAGTADQPVHITIYERNHYVGGRTTTVNAYDDPAKPVELGGSVFVEVNHIMMNATKDLGLEFDDELDATDISPDLYGIWNGEQFVARVPINSGWFDKAKLLARYKLAPFRTEWLMKATVGKFLNMYNAPIFPYRSLTEVAEKLGLLEATGLTGDQFLAKNGLAGLWAQEVIQASTRVNYAQNLGLIHGLETMVCMAATNTLSVKGGNWRIFDRMIETSQAKLHLNTTVSSIKRSSSGGWVITSSPNDVNKDSGEMPVDSQEYDAVVLAGPYQYSGLDLENELEKTPDKIPYVKLHVTLFTSPYRLSRSYFGLESGDRVPATVLTTLNATEENDPKLKQSQGKERVGNVGFFSVSCHGKLERTIEGSPDLFITEYLYKIFSPREFSNDDIIKLLEVDAEDAGSETISWIHRKLWHSYPFEYPRVTFEDFVLDKEETFFYTSGIESFISTMETSSLAGMNVAQLIVDSWLKAEYGKAIKHQPDAKQETFTPPEDLKVKAKL